MTTGSSVVGISRAWDSVPYILHNPSHVVPGTTYSSFGGGTTRTTSHRMREMSAPEERQCELDMKNYLQDYDAR